MPQDFDDFCLKEYDRISEAHFQTATSISEFTRHYITVASLPLVLLVIFGKPADAKPVMDYLTAHPFVVSVPLFGIALVGFLVSGYVMALRHDAVLYARTVNGVRAYFVAKHAQPTPHLVLPTKTNRPSFRGGRFTFVVMAFAVVNMGYVGASVYADARFRGWQLSGWLWIILALVFFAHFLMYFLLSLRQERRFGR